MQLVGFPFQSSPPTLFPRFMDPHPPAGTDMATSTTRPASIDMALDDVIKENRTRRSRYRGGASTREYSPGRQRPARPEYPRRPPRPSGGRHGNVTVTLLNDRYGRQSSSSTSDPRYDGRRHHSRLAPEAATITISNLFHEVSQEDIRELFSQVGPIASVKLQYDRAGRSSGVAQVTYAHRRDALLAIDRFHHVPLDGYPMQIDMAPLQTPRIAAPSRRRSGTLGRARSSSADADGKWARRGEKARPAPSTGQLDAELDSYMMGTQ